MTIAVTQ